MTAGIDTAKDKLDVAVHVGRYASGRQCLPAGGVWRPNSPRPASTRVGIEATGGYERGVVAHLRAAGFTVLVLQPIQVKAYARLHLRRAKNDALDAALIAACAATIEPPEIAPDERLAELAVASDLRRADRRGHRPPQGPPRACRRPTAEAHHASPTSSA